MENFLIDLANRNPDAVLLEPREAYDAALVGVTDSPGDQWDRPPGVVVAVYDAESCIEITETLFGSDRETATEWFYYNMVEAWLGQGTPTFRYRGEDD